MSYVFEKQYLYIDEFEVTRVGLNFLKYSVIKKTNDKPKCEFCGYKFELEDWTHLANVEGKLNHLICGRCADEAVKNGAQGVTMKEERGK